MEKIFTPYVSGNLADLLKNSGLEAHQRVPIDKLPTRTKNYLKKKNVNRILVIAINNQNGVSFLRVVFGRGKSVFHKICFGPV